VDDLKAQPSVGSILHVGLPLVVNESKRVAGGLLISAERVDGHINGPCTGQIRPLAGCFSHLGRLGLSQDRVRSAARPYAVPPPGETVQC
jgi:hypothetical protein